MSMEDEEKTAFITPDGCYCYTRMPLGLKNTGATFQRAMRACLGAQMGRNVEAYIDDIVVKTKDQDSRVLILGLDHNVVDVCFNVAAHLCSQTRTHGALESCSRVLEA